MKKKKNPKVKGKQGQIFDSANYYLEKSKSKKTIEDEEKLKQVTESKESEEASKDWTGLTILEPQFVIFILLGYFILLMMKSS